MAQFQQSFAQNASITLLTPIIRVQGVNKDLDARDTLARNLKWLMELREVKSQANLAKDAGVAQHTISNMLNPHRGYSPQINKVELIAQALGVSTWRMFNPLETKDTLASTETEPTVQIYYSLPQDGRRHIFGVAEREKHYASGRGPKQEAQ